MFCFVEVKERTKSKRCVSDGGLAVTRERGNEVIIKDVAGHGAALAKAKPIGVKGGLNELVVLTCVIQEAARKTSRPPGI